ncbi:MAG TPA: tetratricopeptide repeat protein, partial [Polyangiaceae bacterium]|nr:tetratricopeptide repeat protein [Polyangiaceae bacterium]
MSTPPPSQNAARITQLVSMVQQGQWALAETLLGRLLSEQPHEPDGLQLLGLVRAHQGRTAEAETLYRRSLALRPRQPNVQINLSLLLLGAGRAQEAVALLRSAVRADPNNPDLYLALGQLQHFVGDTAFAERNLTTVLKLRPNDPSAVLSLSGILNLSERAPQSEALLRQTLEQNAAPEMRAALEHNLAVALKVQRRYDEALPLFDSALARSPNLPSAQANRASTLQHLDRREDAIEGFRGALRRDPLHLAAHQELNALLYRM